MNKRGLVLFIVGLLTTTIRAFAQPSTSPLEWNSRGLTLSDFIVSEANSDRASNSSIQWLENTRLFRSSEMPWLKIKYSDIRNIFIPTESWIRVDARTPLKLKYEQLKFDLSEFYCRKVEREANLYGNLKSAMNNYRDSLATAARFFSELTLNGENERVVDSLRAIVSDQLSGIGMPYQDISIPEKKKFVFILSLYEQCSFRLGGISHLLPSPVPFMAVELSAGYCRFGLSAGLSFQQTGDWLQSKESFTYNNQSYPAGARCEDIKYYGLLDYIIVDKPRFQLRPFIGAGIINMSFHPAENLQSFSCPQFLAGLSADYCLSSIWNLFHRELTDIQLRGRLYITRERIADYSGYSINIGVGIAPKFCKTH